MKKTIFSITLGVCVVIVGSTLGYAAGQQEEKVPDQYIVVMKDEVQNVEEVFLDIKIKHGITPHEYYTHTVRGFAVSMGKEKATEIKKDPRVAFIAQDRVVTTFGKPVPPQPPQSIPTGVRRTQAHTNTQKGTGVTVAIIDTGIDLKHPDLAPNIIATKSCIQGNKSGNDDNGHGTHVAGTVAALDNTIGVRGVAPEAKLVAVKVLNAQGSGTWSSVMCGIDWVTANAARYGIKVVNMSLGGGGTSDNACGTVNNDPLHLAVCRSRDAGVAYVVAAGNNGLPVNQFVPAAYNDTVITVSALADSDGLPGGVGGGTPYGPDDTFADFSNHGSDIDFGSPGVHILSTWKSGSYATLSGTSMAAPHVAGVAALYLQTHPEASWNVLRDALQVFGEVVGFGHSDPSGLHPEPVIQGGSL